MTIISTYVIPLTVATLCAPGFAYAATVTLYDQDFEAPVGYNNDGGDVSIFRTVNQHYGDQPVGFEFAQTFTVETLNVSGSATGAESAAFGTGWSDPDGTGGDYAIGMLSSTQDDLLGLAFNVGAFDFFNVGLDISSIDLSTFGGPFVAPDSTPNFRFSLFDNPTGAKGIGGGTLLDSFDLSGTASDRDVFDWTAGSFGLSTIGNTNGNVILQIDLLTGGYAAFDNLLIQASDAPPPPPPTAVVPLPAGLSLLLTGLGIFGLLRWRG